jgi:hypothetical protein
MSRKQKKSVGSMEVVVVGLSHHHAAVDVREKLAVPEIQWNEASGEVRGIGFSMRVGYQSGLVLSQSFSSTALPVPFYF